MLVADFAQAFQVTCGRKNHTGRALHRLDDQGGNGRGVVQRGDALLEFVSELNSAVLRYATGKRIAADIQRMTDMIHTGQAVAKGFAVAGNSADREAAKIDAVISALAADQFVAQRVAGGAMVGKRDFKRGVRRFGA